ncbi:or S-antigen, N-terminal domain-domain-containing protein [Clohesyomyces aquaticus]|uniref:Or S-antigen, N-terminal domain-domain-containing protein n=1 Tax=Clohesyomyces aquaticus TaxID=1231657 RepID=A0A1Y2A1K6_9PLEO|nr:or S-antigen, N-terminal domain-domain-containing protein [Clohesyomyces aquaticus]
MSSSPARGSKTTSSSSLSSRSLLARLKSPLQSKTRNFTEFSIQPDDPHRQYSPGDIITGSVIIKVLKPLRITHLVISLHGYAQVFKNPNSPGDAYRNYSSTVGSGKGKKSGSYFGNGFASLFEDEAVLCGEGRLGEGIYHFNFELEFPSKGLPSSIDFERGTISYMLTATLTRPTTISPTTSTDSKVYLVDTIDIAPISEPKPRVISLEPISRRTRTAKGVRRRATIAETTNQSDSSGSTTRNGRVSELNSVAEESDTPGSPAPSDISFESHISSGGGSGTEYGIRSVNTINTAEGSTSNVNKTTLNGKTITATIEMLKGGFLRGDQIPIHIEISHTKHVRSLKGIIITLYRQARVDMHPALPVAANSKGDKTKSEDYYPKSKTGLGGLSLSSAGSSHLFRKDLSQSFAPLFVDPRTLTADVKCAVRVPDEAFPTISNVPGAMISFKYFVEVVVDIQGKLTGLDRMFPNAGLINVPTTYGGTPGQGRAEDANGSMFSTWGGNFADTDAIRREKGVISCIFEVVIGTKDSERNGKKKQQSHDAGFDGQAGVYEIPPRVSNDTPYMSGGNGQNWYGYEQDAQYYDGYGYDEPYQAGYYEDSGYRDTDGSHPPYGPPNAGNEEVSEKEQLRRAEARLLPSQPPEGSGPSSPPTTRQGIPASAPVLPEDDDPHPPYFPPEPSSTSSSRRPPPFTSNAPSASSHPPPFVAGPSSPPTHPPSLRNADDDTRTNLSSHTITTTSRPPPLSTTASHPDPNKPLPSRPPPSPAPQYFPSAAASSSAFVQPTDDKQELQRRRLELERSAPPPDHDDDDDTPATARPSAPPPTAEMQNLGLAPSAPVLHEDDEGLVGPVSATGSGEETGRRRSEALPVYER